MLSTPVTDIVNSATSRTLSAPDVTATRPSGGRQSHQNVRTRNLTTSLVLLDAGKGEFNKFRMLVDGNDTYHSLLNDVIHQLYVQTPRA